jgi:hypothetical protein
MPTDITARGMRASARDARPARIGCAGPVNDGPVQKLAATDFTQADAMLALLAAAEGTALLVGQMNLNRRVSAAQYLAVLAAIDDTTAPAIEPIDDSERAARGVNGLSATCGRRFTGLGSIST